MKRFLIVSFIFVLALIWFWPDDEVETEIYPHAERINEAEAEVASAVPAPTFSPEKRFVEPSPIPADRPEKNVARRRLPPDVVEFEVYSGNWAITHGDILLGKLENKINGKVGQFKPKKSVLWDSSDIPYGFGEGFDKNRIEEVIQTIEEMNRQTVLNLYLLDPYNPPEDFILFVKDSDKCASYLGKVGGQQPIFLKPKCGPNEIRHEILHALGFIHEQSRRDRDQYVKINWNNIKQGYEAQFDLAPDQYLEHYRGFVFTFDYNSVMLYSGQHFAKSPNAPTIESLTNKEIRPSQGGLSQVDIQRINYLYEK